MLILARQLRALFVLNFAASSRSAMRLSLAPLALLLLPPVLLFGCATRRIVAKTLANNP